MSSTKKTQSPLGVRLAGKKVVFVVTNNDKLGDTGKQTGYYLPEVAHPYYSFIKAGFTVTFASPKGGLSPCDKGSIAATAKDELCVKFLADKNVQNLLANTKKVSDLDQSEYIALLYPGGFGPMWDLPDCKDSIELCRTMYEADCTVGAVCHGTCALVKVVLKNGKCILDGKKSTGFSNCEEEQVQLTKVVPFSLEDEMVKVGAVYSRVAAWGSHVETDGRLVTGQNPASNPGPAMIAVIQAQAKSHKE